MLSSGSKIQSKSYNWSTSIVGTFENFHVYVILILSKTVGNKEIAAFSVSRSEKKQEQTSGCFSHCKVFSWRRKPIELKLREKASLQLSLKSTAS